MVIVAETSLLKEKDDIAHVKHLTNYGQKNRTDITMHFVFSYRCHKNNRNKKNSRAVVTAKTYLRECS